MEAANQDPEPKTNTVENYPVRVWLSMIFVLGYMILIFSILVIESSDTINMSTGDNSLMDTLKVLTGVMTAVVLQIINFWFDKNQGLLRSNSKGEKTKQT